MGSIRQRVTLHQKHAAQYGERYSQKRWKSSRCSRPARSANCISGPPTASPFAYPSGAPDVSRGTSTSASGCAHSRPASTASPARTSSKALFILAIMWKRSSTCTAWLAFLAITFRYGRHVSLHTNRNSADRGGPSIRKKLSRLRAVRYGAMCSSRRRSGTQASSNDAPCAIAFVRAYRFDPVQIAVNQAPVHHQSVPNDTRFASSCSKKSYLPSFPSGEMGRGIGRTSSKSTHEFW